MTADGEQSVWRSQDAGANGHLILPDGNHLVATQPEVILLSPDGEVLRFVAEFEGEPLVFPNDLALDDVGGFYFTDSGSRTEPTGAVYHVDAEWRISRAADGLGFANGIRLSADGGTLYVSESQDNDVLAYDVEAPGRLSNERVFVRFGMEGLDQAKNAPDGMCLDGAGRLYVTHNGMGRVRVVSSEGRVLTSYRTGLLASSNCTFGPDGALYVTGSEVFETGPGGVSRLAIGEAP
jgi:gluconolactonase